ncbi:MAG: acetate--CoA ligase family protein [Patescibacteria group bacterium]|nr:acetate--CoA ligase family protein [Patescibacteria group bacterium]MDD5715189.1 acetate--CoA ligase family protein [Patescibacteria group bacterium]
MLSNFFHPRSIAIIGASHDPSKLGNIIIKNLVEYRFRGKIVPINPKGGMLYGKRVEISVQHLRERPDFAVIVVPAPIVSGVLRECGARKIRAVLIVSAGFGESGEEGKRLERQCMKIARENRIRLLGPNCLGLIIPKLRMNASFAEGLPKHGRIAVLSQSGAMAVAITDWALSSNIGFSALVSLGNKADVHEEELIRYFGNDPDTGVVVLYLESLATGRSLLRTVRSASKRKPVIVLMPGVSTQAQSAVASHTGALAGSHDVQCAALRAAGAIIVPTLEELFAYAELFEKRFQSAGSGVAIVTNAGGPGILATDAVAVSPNISLAIFSEKTVAALHKALPPAAAVGNPVDVLGDAAASRYQKALEVVVQDPSVAGIIAVLTHQYVTDTEKIAHAIVRIQRAHPRIPIVSSFVGGQGVERGRAIFSKAGLLHFPYPERAAQALAALALYKIDRNEVRTFPDQTQTPRGRAVPVLGKAAERIVRPFISTIMPSALARTPERAMWAAKKIGYPIVIKIVHRRMVHKIDSGAVRLNIPTPSALETLLAEWRTRFPFRFGAEEGFFIQPYAPGPLEVVVGAKRDPIIGPYVIVGLGGIFVEVLRSAVITPLPINKKQAYALINESVLGRIFSSKRGSNFPIEKLADILVGISALMMAKPRIVELDLNPVIMAPSSCAVADIRLFQVR